MTRRDPEACPQRRRESLPALWAMEVALVEGLGQQVLVLLLLQWMDAMSKRGRVMEDGFHSWVSRVGIASGTWY